MKRITRATFGSMLVALLLPATALASPMVAVCAGTDCRNLSGLVQENGDIGRLDTTITFADGSELSIAMTFDIDPFINAAVGATNSSGITQTYSFILQTPVVSTLYGTAVLTTSATVSANQNGALATLNQNGALAYSRGLAGVGIASAGLVTLGTGACTTTMSTPCDYGSTSNGFAPETFDVMRLELDFTLSPDGASMTMNSKFDLTGPPIIPEPASLLLMATGMAAALRRFARGV